MRVAVVQVVGGDAVVKVTVDVLHQGQYHGKVSALHGSMLVGFIYDDNPCAKPFDGHVCSK